MPGDTAHRQPASAALVATARRLLDCLGGDLETLRELLDAEAVMELPFAPDGVPVVTCGADRIVAALGYLRVNFARFSIAPHEVYPCPAQNAVIVEATSVGLHRTAGLYQNRYVLVLSFRDGRILRWREYFNPLLIGSASRRNPA